MRVQSYAEWVKSKQCGDKLVFPSEMVARNMATVISWIRPDDPQCQGMMPYRCPWCSTDEFTNWHIGHDTGVTLGLVPTQTARPPLERE